MTETIDEVIERLDEIVAQCRRERSQLGYFAALYRKVTREVKKGIAVGRFEDGPRMERLDVVFANRYLDAYGHFRRGVPPTESWRIAFRMRDKPNLLVLQHLLLGMNAHINLDLGIAAAHTCPGTSLPELKGDFDEINNLLAELLDGVQGSLSTVSRSMWLLNRYVNYSDKVIVNFRMSRARAAAWEVAERLAPLSTEEQAAPIRILDRNVAARGILICTPVGPVGRMLQVVARLERKDVVAVIDCLSEEEPE